MLMLSQRYRAEKMLRYMPVPERKSEFFFPGAESPIIGGRGSGGTVDAVFATTASAR